jgi:hypothetical protein
MCWHRIKQPVTNSSACQRLLRGTVHDKHRELETCVCFKSKLATLVHPQYICCGLVFDVFKGFGVFVPPAFYLPAVLVCILVVSTSWHHHASWHTIFTSRAHGVTFSCSVFVSFSAWLPKVRGLWL